MSKQAKYWVIGIMAVGIVILAWVGISGSRDNDKHASDTTAPSSEAVTGLNNGTDEDNPSAGMEQEQNSSADQNVIAYMEDQDKIMADMMTDMEDIPTTGSASIDYLNGMIPHHESAIAMAESFIKRGGSDPELKKLADDIIKVQSTEIEQMKAMIQKLESEEAKNNDMEAAYMEDYNNMFDAHHMSHMTPTPGSVDEAFADGMIIHHQMAADMSKIILDYTEQKDVKELAQNIIDVQEKEITQMQEILKNLKNK